MADIVMAYVVMAYVVMAYIVIAYVVMAYWGMKRKLKTIRDPAVELRKQVHETVIAYKIVYICICK